MSDSPRQYLRKWMAVGQSEQGTSLMQYVLAVAIVALAVGVADGDFLGKAHAVFSHAWDAGSAMVKAYTPHRS